MSLLALGINKKVLNIIEGAYVDLSFSIVNKVLMALGDSQFLTYRFQISIAYSILDLTYFYTYIIIRFLLSLFQIL